MLHSRVITSYKTKTTLECIYFTDLQIKSILFWEVNVKLLHSCVFKILTKIILGYLIMFSNDNFTSFEKFSVIGPFGLRGFVILMDVVVRICRI